MRQADINYKVIRRQVKYPRLEFKTGELVVIAPEGYDERKLINKNRKWINRKSDQIKEILNDSSKKNLADRSDDHFRELVCRVVNENSEKLGVKYNRVYFRTMKTKWASLSKKRNLTVNKVMKFLPKKLINYIIYHELAHIIERKHNERFWKIISKEFKNYKNLERDLFMYWFLVFNEKGDATL